MACALDQHSIAARRFRPAVSSRRYVPCTLASRKQMSSSIPSPTHPPDFLDPQTEDRFATDQDAEDYLAKFTDYERMAKGVQYPDDLFDLRRIQGLLERVGNPHVGLHGIHIAGTKGKGSTAVFSDALLRAHGLTSGLYTSPHLIAKEERIQVQGLPIGKDEFLGWMNFLRPSLMALKDTPLAPTFFDIMTTLCFLHFRAQGVESAVMEVGLGGRLDSTNTFLPDVCVITRLGMDHMEKLGNTLDKIAAEKAGIVKTRVPVVSLFQEAEARVVLEAKCREMEAPVSWVGGEIRVETDLPGGRGAFSVFTPGGSYPGLRLSVLGQHQKLNAAAAIAAAEIFFQRTGRKALEPDCVRRTLVEVRIPGRIDILETDPFLVVDGAHNPLSMEALLRALREELHFRDLHVLFACSRDKPIPTLLTQLAASARRWTLTHFDFPRIEEAEIVLELLREIDPDADCSLTRNPDEALEDARRRSKPEDCILCCGSFYLVGEILKRVAASKRRV